MTGLSAQVAALCRGLGSRLPPSATAAVDAAAGACAGPLVIAVAGRVNAGKSTVVNALLGQRVARTDSRECTAVITVFSYGPSESVEVVARNGDRREYPLDRLGLIPADIPVGPETARIQVRLANRNLDGLTVVDTPGLASAHAENSNRTADFMGLEQDDPASVNAVQRAAAALYVFTQAFRADDLDAVRGFRSVSARVGSSPANAVGILNKADLLGDGTSLSAAQALAVSQTAALRRELSTVMPLVGLLGETVEAGRFTETHAEALRGIAALRDGERRLLMFTPDRFRTADVPIGGEVREQLLDRLDLFGVTAAVGLILAGQSSATAIRAALLQASGLADLRSTIDLRFRARADALKAADALGRLARLASKMDDQAAARAIRSEVERFLLQPGAHVLAELAVSAELATGTVRLPEPMLEDATRLLGPGDPAARLGLPAGAPRSEMVSAAGAAANHWRAFANIGASPAQARVSMILHRTAALLAGQLSGTGA